MQRKSIQFAMLYTAAFRAAKVVPPRRRVHPRYDLRRLRRVSYSPPGAYTVNHTRSTSRYFSKANRQLDNLSRNRKTDPTAHGPSGVRDSSLITPTNPTVPRNVSIRIPHYDNSTDSDATLPYSPSTDHGTPPNISPPSTDHDTPPDHGTPPL